jgi:hypothetical protein
MTWILVLIGFVSPTYADMKQTNIPMQTKEACTRAAENLAAKFSAGSAICLSTETGEVLIRDANWLLTHRERKS